MGVAVTPICGQFVCGATAVSTWKTTWGRPTVVLQPRTFSITITEGPMISLTVNRPVLFLNARPLAKQTSTAPTFGRPVLRLSAKPFRIEPFFSVLLNRPVLYLRGKAVLLGLSSSLAFNRPRLILLGGRLARVGRAGLIPTIPESRPLVPTADNPDRPLAPTSAGSRTLVASATGTRPLQPTVDEDDVLLVPTETVVR